MKKKRNYKQEVKDLYEEKKPAIKTAMVCLWLGFCYGFYKGTSTSQKMLSAAWERVPKTESDEFYDEFELTDSNCDDPELIELVASENS